MTHSESLKEHAVVFDGTTVFVTPMSEFNESEQELMEAFDDLDEAFDFAETQTC